VKGRSLLAHLLGRLEKSESIDNIVVGTPDEEILDEAERCGVDGWISDRDEDDVLGRYVDIAKAYRADVVVRITGDCPLIDGGVVDRTVAVLGNADFASNVWPRTFPQGLDVEVMPVSTLYRLDRILPKGHTDREHVCVYVYGKPEFSLVSCTDVENNSHLVWCVDTEQDFERVAIILERYGDLPYREILRRLHVRQTDGVPVGAGNATERVGKADTEDGANEGY
jgi:spore coat polysaccharide biosynthesis protein SpsF (cytidylyltransferase family)